jgi:hypothetical protein
MAFEKLGQTDQARMLFQQLIDEGMRGLGGEQAVEGKSRTNSSFSNHPQAADDHYLVGLGQLGLNNKDKAKLEFSSALLLCPDHFAAKMSLEEMKP